MQSIFFFFMQKRKYVDQKELDADNIMSNDGWDYPTSESYQPYIPTHKNTQNKTKKGGIVTNRSF